MEDGGNDLDALLDEAFDSFEEEKKAEAARQEERKKEKETRNEENISADGPSEEQLTQFLEQALGQLDNSDGESGNLRSLVEEAQSIMKSDGTDDSEVLSKSANLINDVLKEIGDDSTFKPIIEKLSESLSELVSVIDTPDGPKDNLNQNEQSQLMDIIKNLGAKSMESESSDKNKAEGENGETKNNGEKKPELDEDLMKLMLDAMPDDVMKGFTDSFPDLLKNMTSVGGEGEASKPTNSSASTKPQLKDENLTPEEIEKRNMEYRDFIQKLLPAMIAQDQEQIIKLSNEAPESVLGQLNFQTMLTELENHAQQMEEKEKKETGDQHEQQHQNEEPEKKSEEKENNESVENNNESKEEQK